MSSGHCPPTNRDNVHEEGVLVLLRVEAIDKGQEPRVRVEEVGERDEGWSPHATGLRIQQACKHRQMIKINT